MSDNSPIPSGTIGQSEKQDSVDQCLKEYLRVREMREKYISMQQDPVSTNSEQRSTDLQYAARFVPHSTITLNINHLDGARNPCCEAIILYCIDNDFDGKKLDIIFTMPLFIGIRL